MKEKEVHNDLDLQKKSRMLYFLLFLFLTIAAICIGSVFYIYYDRKKDPADLSEMVSNGTEEVGKYVKLEIAGMPEILAVNKSSDEHIYFVKGSDQHIYIAKLSGNTVMSLKRKYENESEKSNAVYDIHGFIYNIDGGIQSMALFNSGKMFKDVEVNADNFAQYFGKVYIDENKFPEGRRMLEMLKCIVLAGVFFLILALGYILPLIMKLKKTESHEEIMRELERQLEEFKKNPYMGYKIQFMDHYILSGVEAVRYDDIIWGYTETLTRFMMKMGRELIVYTKDKKRHTILSAGESDCVPDDVLKELHRKNPRMRVGYDEENKKFFDNYQNDSL